MSRKPNTLLLNALLTIAITIVSSPALAKEQSFSQGKGYEQGAYDTTAIRPTITNWQGQSQFEGTNTPEKYWVYSVDDNEIITSSVVIGNDGTKYFVTADDDHNKGYLYALGYNGTRKWKAKLSKDNSSDPVIGPGGNIFVASGEDFYSFTPEGKQKLKRTVTKIKGGTPGTPVLSKDGVFFIEYSTCAIPTITAVTSNGKVKWVKEWELSADLAINRTGNLYAPVWAGGGLLAINQKGETTWRWEVDFTSHATPTFGQDGTMYVLNRRDGYQQLDAFTPEGESKWNLKFEKRELEDSAISISDEGDLYFTTFGLREPYTITLNAVTPEGNIKWRKELNRSPKRSDLGLPWAMQPAIDKNGDIYAIGVGLKDDEWVSYLHAVSPEGKDKWSVELGAFTGASPTIDKNGDIIVPAKKKLFIIGSDKPEKELEVKALTVSKKTVTMKVGEQVDLKVTATYKDGTKEDVTEDVDWSSSKEDVIDVEKGELRGLEAGITTLSANYGGKTVKIKVTVKR